MNWKNVLKDQRPDYPDLDGDGDTDEPMVDALETVEQVESVEKKEDKWMRGKEAFNEWKSDIDAEFAVFIDQMANYMNPDNLTWPQLKESSPQKEWIEKANELKELLINMQMSLFAKKTTGKNWRD